MTRIVGGRLGGRVLRAPRGQATRPTADRVREAIFNILLARGPAPSTVLDLYAGTGALGLESLSRGAEQATLVEEHPATARLIRENADALGLGAAVTVAVARVRDWLRRAPAATFGWVFLDPPYAATDELDGALALLAERPLLHEEAVVVAEHDARHTPVAPAPLVASDTRRYGQTAVTLFTRGTPA
jgi:16S rRNA (guanine966-N2)-methyltransferase